MDEKGLYGKYRVRKTNGEPVGGCFVLRPDRDRAARVALLAYADNTNNEELARDIREWMRRIAQENNHRREIDR